MAVQKNGLGPSSTRAEPKTRPVRLALFTDVYDLDVYDLEMDTDKCLFIHEIRDIRDLHLGPCTIADDFNLIMDATDKSNANLNKRMMRKFTRALSELELKELYLNVCGSFKEIDGRANLKRTRFF
jgi:hypothetical protein